MRIFNKPIPSFLLSFLFLLSFGQLQATLIYVHSNASGSNDGSSWEDAHTSLTDALAASNSGDELWIAAGVYKPGVEKTDVFILKESVALYGGFLGSETSLEQRDWENNESILSGDIFGDDQVDEWVLDKGDNTYHVLIAGVEVSENTILDGLTIKGGHAINEFGSDGTIGGGLLMEGNPQILNCSFTNNYSLEGGGAIYLKDGASLSLTNSRFLYNRSEENGGCIFKTGTGDGVISESVFFNNRAIGGGAIYWRNSELEIEECNFQNNNGGLFGAALFLEENAGLTLNSSNFEGNEGIAIPGVAPLSGGAISAENAGDIEITDCNFIENKARASGGALSISNSNLTKLHHSTFDGNNSLFGWGGAILFLNSSSLTQSDWKGNIFSNNTAENYGGAIQIENKIDLTMDSCFFQLNEVRTGGGGGINTYNLERFQMLQCAFEGNSSAKTGAAVNSLGGKVGQFDQCEFINNTCEYSLNNSYAMEGGAIYATNLLDDNSVGTLELGVHRSSFKDNFARKKGGAIFTQLVNVDMTNTVFENNICEGEGLFYVQASEWQVANCLFMGNDIFSSDLLVLERDPFPLDTPKVDFINCTSFSSNGIRLLDDGTVNLINNIMWYPVGLLVLEEGAGSIHAKNCLLGTPFEGEGMLNAAPSFENSSEGDFRITMDGVTINAGILDTTGLNLPAVDLAGNLRVQEGRIDIGAYEYGDELSGLFSPSLESQTSVFPNPSSGLIQIDFSSDLSPENFPLQFEIYNLKGQLLNAFSIEEKGESLDLRSTALPFGHYIYQLKNGEQVLGTGRLVFE